MSYRTLAREARLARRQPHVSLRARGRSAVVVTTAFKRYSTHESRKSVAQQRGSACQTFREPHRSTPRATAAEKMRRSTAAARTVLCGTVIRCARALSAAPMDTIQRCMLRRAQQRGGPVPLVTRKVQESIERRRINGARTAAVLVPIASIDDEPHVVFSVRSDKVSTHKSQVSFPGGHIELNETAEQAALREAREEFGPDFERGFSVVAECREVLAVTGTVVTPVVACRSRPLDLGRDVVYEEDEVAEVFSLPVAHLLDPVNREERVYENRGKLPVFHGGPAEIWGLTAYVLDGVLEKLVRPCVGGLEASEAPRGSGS